MLVDRELCREREQDSEENEEWIVNLREDLLV